MRSLWKSRPFCSSLKRLNHAHHNSVPFTKTRRQFWLVKKQYRGIQDAVDFFHAYPLLILCYCFYIYVYFLLLAKRTTLRAEKTTTHVCTDVLDIIVIEENGTQNYDTKYKRAINTETTCKIHLLELSTNFQIYLSVAHFLAFVFPWWEWLACRVSEKWIRVCFQP